MTDRELARAAQQAIARIDDERLLCTNPLFARRSRLSFDEMRAIVLNAIGSLAPIEPMPSFISKKRRLHEIVVRCDLQGEPHKAVLAALGISRRQFYRERREALLFLALEIRRSIAHTGALWSSLDLGDAGRALIEALRSAGQYAAVWREACALAPRHAGEPLETKLWIVASEAARYLALPDDASEALDRARTAHARYERNELSYALALWIAIGEINLRWASADFEGARAVLKHAVATGPCEQTLFGDKAVLVGIMLAYAASMELDAGNWEQARTLLNRASVLARRGGPDAPRRFAIAGQSLLRLQAQLAWRTNGDLLRSLADHEAALRFDRETGQLGSTGMSAAFYATALARTNAGNALAYVDYGLDIVRHYYYGDRLARLTLEVLPILARERGTNAARDALEQAQRDGLGPRDTALLDLARIKSSSCGGDFSAVAERADDVAARLTLYGMHAWACEAQLLGVEAAIQLGFLRRARRQLDGLSDRLEAGSAQSRSSARKLGTSLAL